jgi:hypothetical protein
MLVSVIGCGQSAIEWYRTPCNLSIGCNDMLKFGHQPDQLVLVNFEHKFSPDRLKTILKTKAKVWTHTSTWKKAFPNAEVIRLTPFNGHVRQGLIYSLRTSPVVAISLAVKQGATDIVLFGVDFLNHKSIRTGTRAGDHEVKCYLKLFQRLNEKGINVHVGAAGSCFDNQLPLWQPWTGKEHELTFERLVI